MAYICHLGILKYWYIQNFSLGQFPCCLCLFIKNRVQNLSLKGVSRTKLISLGSELDILCIAETTF